MSEKEILTDFEIEQIKYKKNLDYTLSQIRIMTKVFLYTSFGSILFVIIFLILKGFKEGFF